MNQQGEEISEEEYSMSMDPMAWASEPALLVKKAVVWTLMISGECCAP